MAAEEQGSMSEERYLTAQQVADRYNLSLQWVYGCRSLPRRKIGKYLRFLESDLEVWEKRHTETSRTYGFYSTDNTKDIQQHYDIHRGASHNSILSRGQEFALLFDILP